MLSDSKEIPGKTNEEFSRRIRRSGRNTDFSPYLTLNLGMFRAVTPEREFCRTCSFRRIVPGVILHDFKVFREKMNDEIFRERRKTIEKDTVFVYIRRRFARWRAENIKKLIERGTSFGLWSLWKSNRISIWTDRYGDIAVLKEVPNLALSPLFPIFGEPEFSRTWGFRQNVPTIILHDFKWKNIHINELDFP